MQCLKSLRRAECIERFVVIGPMIRQEIEGFGELPVDERAIWIEHPESNDFWEKLERAVLALDTKFCAWLAEDDLYTLEYLERGLNFLIQNPEFTAIDGVALKFNTRLYENRSVLFDYSYNKEMNKSNYNQIKVLHEPNDFDSTIACRSGFGTLVHSICVRKYFADAVRLFQAYPDLKQPELSDKIISLFFLSRGSVGFFSFPSHVRCDINSTFSLERSTRTKSYLDDCFFSDRVIQILTESNNTFSPRKVVRYGESIVLGKSGSSRTWSCRLIDYCLFVFTSVFYGIAVGNRNLLKQWVLIRKLKLNVGVD